MSNKLFNIYYINFPKVYEIKMMLSNLISLNQEITQENYKEKEGYLKAKLGFNLMDIFKIGEVETGGSLKSNNTQKVFETFEVKTTKSIILNEIFEKAIEVTSLEKIQEGKLIKVNNVSLKLLNEPELRTIKLIGNGGFKNLGLQDTGIDFNSLLNSMLKDYAYKIRGKVNTADKNNLIVKIPLSFESEFESSYSVDDLFIGKVTIVGIYKGIITLEKLKNSFEFFQELGGANPFTHQVDDEIEESQYSDNVDNHFSILKNEDTKEYHYIDLLAIVQTVGTDE